MRAYLDTSLSPSMKVYDSKEPGGPGIVRRLLQPQVTITDDTNQVLFQYGKTPPDYLPVLIVGFVSMWLLGIGIFKRVRR